MQVLNTKVVPVTEYLEVHPLGRAEWLRFFGVLFGVERKADSLYSTIAERYTRVVVADTSNRPTVVFGSYWQGQWFVPSGNSYMARLIAGELGYGGRLVTDPSKPDGAPYKTVDGTHGAALLGWRPSRDFHQGVRDTIAGYLQCRK